MNGLHDYLLAILLTPLLLLGWAAVQALWRKHIETPDDEPDQYGDVLAGRGGCGPCGCKTPCQQPAQQEGEPSQ